ncbi:TRAPP II complex [Syncephalis fuscata]|nr:TRAPP II complex [Syncephalis fuscata]
MTVPVQPQLTTGLLDQARVRVLLVPILPGQSTLAHISSFQKYARQLAVHNAVRVADLKSGAITSSSSITSSSRWTEGRLRFNFITEAPQDHEYLDEFQPYRQVLGVVGVACCTDFASVDQLHKEFQANTKDFSRSVVRRCIAFEPREDQRTCKLDGVTIIPRQGEIDTYLESFIQEFGQQLLDAFNIMIAAIERRTIISTPDIGRPTTPNNNSSTNLNSTGSNSSGYAGSFSGTTNAQPQPQPMSSYFRSASPGGAMTGVAANSNNSNNNSGNNNFNISNTASNEAKARKRTPGRAQKLIGDLLVLSGRLPEAVIAYISSIDQARSGGDYLWQATATEGLCAAIGLLSLTDAPDVGPLPSLNSVTSTSYGFTFDPSAPMIITSTDTLRKFLADIPSRYREIALMYERAQVWPVVYIEACLKMARFSITNETGRRWRTEEASIWIARAWNYAGDILAVGDKISFATIAAELLSDIGAHRKRAFWLRRVTTLLFPLLHRAIAQNDVSRQDVTQQLIGCLNRVCPAYGIEDYVPGVTGTQICYEEEQIDLNHTFGWAILQVDVLRECIRVCEAIRDYDRMVHYTTQLLRRRRDYLHRDDQARVASSMHRMVIAAINSGARKAFYNAFWHNGFLRHLEACKPLDHRRPHLRKRRTDGGTQAGTDPFIYNPFAKKSNEDTSKIIWVVDEPVYTMVTLWNPFAFDLELQEIRLVTKGLAFESEPAVALIPAGAPLTLRLSGTPKEAGQLSIIGCSVVVFGGIRQEFYIRPSLDENDNDDSAGGGSGGGNNAQMIERRKTNWPFNNGLNEGMDFGLEAFGMSINNQLDSKTAPADNEPLSPATTTATATAPAGMASSIEVQVIQQMPLVRVKNTTLNHGAVMLCEGEATTMTITLENIGREVVNFVLPTFAENPTPPPTSNHQLRPSKEDTYEQDRFLAYTHAFQWPLTDRPERVRQSTGGTIQVDYGHELLSNTTDTTANIVYTRQLSIPVLLTVRRTLELLNADVLAVNQRDIPLSNTDAMGMINQVIEDRRDQWCLLTLDIRNIWSTPFHLQFSLVSKELSTLNRDEEGEEAAIINMTDINMISNKIDSDKVIALTSVTLQPGSAKRILLPVERLGLKTEAEQPIPLVNKQFVVDKGPKPSMKEEQLTRQLFWYKEHMLQRITANWTCSPGKEGRFDLRAIRLTEPMLDVLKSDDIVFKSSLTLGDKVIDSADGRFICQVDQFFTLVIRLTNNNDLPSKLFFRAQPSLDYCNGQKEQHLTQHVLWSGQLQCILPEIQPNEYYEYKLPVYFLRCGRYTLACHVEDIRTNIVHLNGELEFDVQPS